MQIKTPFGCLALVLNGREPEAGYHVPRAGWGQGVLSRLPGAMPVGLVSRGNLHKGGRASVRLARTCTHPAIRGRCSSELSAARKVLRAGLRPVAD